MLASIRDWLAVCVCLETCDLTMYNFQREKPTAFRRVYHPGVVGITSCPNEACTPRGPHAQAYLAKSVATCTCGLGVPANFCPKDFNFVQCGDPMIKLKW